MRACGNGKLSVAFSKDTLPAGALEFLFNNADDAILILDTKGRVISINRAAKEMSKGNRKFFVGRSFENVVPHGIVPLARRCFKTAMRGKPASFEIRFCRAQGIAHHIEVIVTPCVSRGKVVAVLGIARDITERKQVEQKLRESEERYRCLIETLPEAIYTIARDGNIRSLNSTFEKLTGWKCKQWIGKSFVGLVHPEDLPVAMETFEHALNGEVSPPYELRIRCKSGEYLIGEFVSRPCIENGKVVGESGIVRDVTQRRKSEEALRSSEAKFRALFENVPDGVYQSTPDGKIVTANPAIVQMLGYSSLDELRALDISYDLYVNPGDRKAWMRKLNRNGQVRNAELTLRRKNGKVLIVLENSNAVHDEQGRILYYEGTLTDITERKTLEERLSALNSYGGKLSAAQRLRDVYDLTLDALEQTLGFENAAFLIVSKGNLCLECQRGHPQPVPELSLKEGGITVKAANTGKPVLVPDVRKRKDYVEGTLGVQSELAVPVMVGSRVLGVLNVESKKLGAFDEKDVTLLQILASHAATAIGNLEKRDENEKRSTQLALLMKYSAEMIHYMKLRRRLQKIAEAIRELGWRRVVIRAVRSGTMDLESLEDLVTAGLTGKEKEFLWKHKTSGEVWRERFGLGFERFKIGEFYHLPWSDPWVRRKFSRSTVPSKLAPEEMVDWDPQDLLYAPLKLADGRVVGILSIDDPLDGRRPTRESLAPLELFIHQAAVAIQSAQLFEQLERAKDQVREYAKRLEEKVKERTLDLRRNEEKLRSIITASPDAITVSDLSGNIIDCNQAALEAFRGKSRQDLVGKNALELIAKKDRQRAMENMKKTLEQGSIRNIEYALLTKNGSAYPAELSASLVRDASGNPVGFVAITSDITERKRMEQQVLRSERLAAMGEVAAMVGHDLRNPLTGIAGATYYLKMKMGSRGDSRKKREMLELIEKDIDYSNKIVNDLLDYSREIRLDLTETSPRSIVEETLSMVEAPDNVAILNLARNMPKLSVDMEKIKRVFLNIVKNAVDAMPKGGRLTIKGRKSGANFEFSFEDTGVGMAQQMVEKIFSPLFTTKAKGMGFGLAICKRIVEAHRGKISVETAIGKGTTFIVTVPLKPEVEGGERVWMNVPESLLSTTMKA